MKKLKWISLGLLGVGVLSGIFTPLVQGATQQDKVLEVIRTEKIKQQDQQTTGAPNKVVEEVTKLRKQKVGETLVDYLESQVYEALSAGIRSQAKDILVRIGEDRVIISLRGYRGTLNGSMDWVDRASQEIRQVYKEKPLSWQIQDTNGTVLAFVR